MIVPVLSSSSVSTSPATSTALPLLAMMLARRARSMPAMPMAASRAPIVVGIRQTSRATSVGTSVPRLLHRLGRCRGSPSCTARRCSAIGQSAAVTIRKISVKADSTSDRAISLGVRWRMAPSTRAIMRSRNDLPAPAVISHDDAVGEHARAAGDAGAVAAGLADDRGRLAGDRRLVDRGDAFDDLAVAGNDLSGLDDDAVAGLQVRWRRSLRSGRRRAGGRPGVSRRVLRSASAWALPRASASAVAKLANSTRQEQPDVQRDQVADATPGSGSRSSAAIVKTSVRTVPTSTTNITGFFHWMSGRSMTNDCSKRRLQQLRREQARCGGWPGGSASAPRARGPATCGATLDSRVDMTILVCRTSSHAIR